MESGAVVEIFEGRETGEEEAIAGKRESFVGYALQCFRWNWSDIEVTMAMWFGSLFKHGAGSVRLEFGIGCVQMWMLDLDLYQKGWRHDPR